MDPDPSTFAIAASFITIASTSPWPFNPSALAAAFTAPSFVVDHPFLMRLAVGTLTLSFIIADQVRPFHQEAVLPH